MKKKKICAMFLTAAMAATLLAGCGNNDASSQGSSTGGSTGGDAAQSGGETGGETSGGGSFR